MSDSAKKLISWPDWMPLPEQTGYSYELTDRRARTDMEVGSLLRVEYDTDETKITCQLVLSQVESAWFEAFEKKVLSQGSLWFEIPVQTSGHLNWHTARFAQRPKASIAAPFHTKYNFVLEIDTRPEVICPQVTELLLCVSPHELCGTAENLRSALQETLPSIELPTYWQAA